MVTLPEQNSNAASTSSQTAVLPTRLRDWTLSEDETKFIYGGDEVDVSMWSTELSFRSPKESGGREDGPSGIKRKRDDSLLPAELWRAKNVSQDDRHLG
jgi:ribosome biogenesis protein NSA1